MLPGGDPGDPDSPGEVPRQSAGEIPRAHGDWSLCSIQTFN